MNDPLISVVVPFYNNEDLLADCLASIAAQTFANLQVVMVDDGSTDASADIALARAGADSRFTLIRVANGGPGWARNHGVAAATGAYLAFVDADDMLPPDAYEVMLEALERSGSDFVSGGVRRLSGSTLGESGLHDRAIKAGRTGTHIGAVPDLFYDISVWNKLFRRSFWDAARLSLPEGMFWEDLVAMTKAHVLATAVDVITEPIYYWRDRDSAARSITQSRAVIANLRDRVTALMMIDEFLRERGTPAMLRQHQDKALVNDLWLYVRDLPEADAGYQRELVGLIGGYLGQVSPRVRRALPATRKLAYHLIARGEAADLVGFAGWLAEHPGRTPPMVRTARGLRADLPLRRDRRLSIPDAVFRPRWRELDPLVRVDRILPEHGRLVLEGHAYLPSVDIGKRRSTSKLVVLLPRGGRRPPLVLRARSVRRPDVTAASGQDRYSYDWAGLRCEIGRRWFRVARRWLVGDWDCFVLVRARSTWRPARLHTPGPAAENPGQARIAPGFTLGAQWSGRRLSLTLRPDAATGPSDQAAPGGHAPAGQALTGQPPTGQSLTGQPLAGQPPTGQSLTGQEWAAGGALVVHGQITQAGDHEIVLRHAGGWGQHTVRVGQTATGPFNVSLPVGAMDVFGQVAPLRDGQWALSPRRVEDPLETGQPAADDHAGGAGAPLARCDTRPVVIGRKRFRMSPDGRLLVEPALRLLDRGRIRRRLLRDAYYPVQRLLPVREAILLVSFEGKQCGDNPRGIADELRRRGDRREQVWAVADWSVPVPPGAGSVLIGTAAYYAALGRSRHLIVNDHMPRPYRKRRGQRHVQTWHGTPLKRLGYDMLTPGSAAGHRYLDFMAGDVAQWDLLLSPNPFSTPIMRHAFGFDGQIRETGYPRNDRLVAPGEGADARQAQIRRRLGVPDGKRVAMYVPTWRDDKHDAAGRYLLDFRLDTVAAANRLGADYVLLIRGHHLMAGGLPPARNDSFAVDVTGYPDINDLLLVTDVLITDYSSVMFDFAPTGRPMLFFTYDLEQYRDQLRGFYFDFEASAPGPLLAGSDEVVAALADLDGVAARYGAARAAFAERFCPLDDGKAAARACDLIFSG